MYGRFGPREMGLSSLRTQVPILKHEGGLMIFLGCFSSTDTGQSIAIRGIRKSEDYVKILDENQLSAQNLNLSQLFTF